MAWPTFLRDEIEPDEQPPEDEYSEIQTANTHPEK